MTFLDPTNDIVFQRIFGDLQRTSSLISLINAVLGLEGAQRVVSVSVVAKDLLPKIEDMKDTIVDVRARDGLDQEFIVEMQCRGGSSWMKRALYTACKGFVDQLAAGDDHPKLRPIYFIGVLRFEMPWADVLKAAPPPRRSGPKPAQERQGRRWLTHHVLKDMETNLQSSADFSLHFMELPVFDKALEDCGSVIEQWAWFFKHGGKVAAIPASIVDKGIIDAFHTSEQHGWSAEELDRVEKLRWARYLAHSELEEAESKGEAKGMTKGLAVAKKDIAQRLASAGLASEQILAAIDVDAATLRQWLAEGSVSS